MAERRFDDRPNVVFDQQKPSRRTARLSVSTSSTSFTRPEFPSKLASLITPVIKEQPATLAIPVVLRKELERATRPERLSLEGRGLNICPQFEREEQLKLLSFENNFIRRIERINLVNLIFLDFHNNSIQTISGLDDVPLLRVLLLGKNCIHVIEHLEHVPLLDVLDMHENSIAKIENINHLMSLRVLNLERNRIEALDNVSGMKSLTEINLSHNQVTQCHNLTNLPSLRRLFLAHNSITVVASIERITTLDDLQELTLKWNPSTTDSLLMQHVTASMPSLIAFDVWPNNVRPAPTIITRPISAWNGVPAISEDLVPNSPVTEEAAATQPSAVVNEEPAVTPIVGEKAAPVERAPKKAREKEPELACMSATPQKLQEWWEQHKDKLDVLNQNMFPSFYQFQDNKTKLSIFGIGFQALDLENASLCSTLSFNYVAFNQISPFFYKISLWPNLTRIEFSCNNMFSFYQLDALSILTRITDLSIASNPINLLPLHRQYLLFRLPNLTGYNDMVVTSDEAHAASHHFDALRLKWRNEKILRTKGFMAPSLKYSWPSASGTSVSLLDALSSDARPFVQKKQLKSAGISRLCSRAISMGFRIRLFEQAWPNVAADFILDVLTGGQEGSGGGL